jgi:glutamine amidotransferase
MRVAVIDYGAGNLRSVETALRHLGADFVITEDPSEVGRADRLIIPGVGDAGAAMERLEAAGLADAIRTFHRSEKPILGICLGSQIVLEGSEERDARCLGLIPGRAKRIPRGPGLKVPHMGWNTVRQAVKSPLLAGVPDDASFYFVHSYYPDPADPSDTFTTTEYGVQFASGIARDNLVAFQFHPEKSGRHGLRILTNFLKRS